jgi:hypothetical protein
MSFFKKLFKKEVLKPIESYHDFWSWFTKNEKKFHKIVKQGGSDNITSNFFDLISPKLDELKEGIWYLTGMLNDTTVDLVLTADGEVKNFYLIEELVAVAPEIKGWKFTAHKPESDIKNVGIKMEDFSFTSDNISFYSNDLEDYPDEIDLTIIHDDYTEENKQDIVTGTYIFIDNFLGELDSLTLIDNISFKSKSEAEKELISIEKLKSFIIWREKEFIEKYEGIRRNTADDTYSSMEASLENGNKLIAVVNSDLLNWDAKASHPWVLRLKVKYNGENNNGFPNDKTYQLLDKIENEITKELKDADGYLNIGRETANSLREVYFACREYRKPCKVVDKIIKKYNDSIDLDYEIYKDKYWRSFERFQA